MRCLTRYMLLEFLKVFVLALAVMTLLMVLAVVGQYAIRNGLSPFNIVRLVPFALPEAMMFAIPATTLFAACSIYGRVAAENELVAIKSLGISPLAMIWPTLAAAFLLSLVVVCLTDVAVTWGRNGFKRVVLESVEQIAYGMLRTQRSYSSSRFSIHVTDVVGRRLIHPTLTLRADDGGSPWTFTAEEAQLKANEDSLRVTLRNWELDGGGGMLECPGVQVFDIPLEDAAAKVGRSGRPSDIAMRSISGEIQKEEAKIVRLEQAYANEAAYHLMTGDFSELSSDQWWQRRSNLDHARNRLHRLHTEPWRRWANGFSCFAFVFVGAPLAIRMRNSDVWTSFAVCFLPILAIYYPLLSYGVGQAKSGALPPYCVWAGNLVLAVLGTVLIRRALRH